METSRGLSTIECLDNKSKKWEIITSMDSRRQHSACLRHGSFLYCFGGCDEEGNVLATAGRYNLTERRWEDLPAMSVPRSAVTCHHNKGRLYLLGGFDGTYSTTSVECFDVKTLAWQDCEDMASAKSEPCSGSKDHFIIIAGGAVAGKPTNSVEALDTQSNKWISLPSMKVDRASAASTCTLRRRDINIVVAGGKTATEKASRSVEMLIGDLENPSTLEWLPLPPMLEGRTAASIICAGGLLVAVGGKDANGKALKSCEYFSFDTYRWSPMPNMQGLRTLCSLSYTDGRLFALGGSDGRRGLTTVESINMIPLLKKEMPARKTSIFDGRENDSFEWCDAAALNRGRTGSRVILA